MINAKQEFIDAIEGKSSVVAAFTALLKEKK